MSFAHNSVTTNDEPQWAEVDKTKLPREAFAEMGDEGKPSTWKVAHHWVKNGKDPDSAGRPTEGQMYLHTGGLCGGGAPRPRADPEVVKHLEAHRKALETPGEANSTASHDLEASAPADGQLSFTAPLNLTAGSDDGGGTKRLPTIRHQRLQRRADAPGELGPAGGGRFAGGPAPLPEPARSSRITNTPTWWATPTRSVWARPSTSRASSPAPGPRPKRSSPTARTDFPGRRPSADGCWSASTCRRAPRPSSTARTTTGPIIVARKFALGEVSVTALGADTSSSTTIAASAKDAGPQGENHARNCNPTAHCHRPGRRNCLRPRSRRPPPPRTSIEVRASAAAEYKRIAKAQRSAAPSTRQIAASAILRRAGTRRIGIGDPACRPAGQPAQSPRP